LKFLLIARGGSTGKYLWPEINALKVPSGERQMRENRGAKSTDWGRVWGRV